MPAESVAFVYDGATVVEATITDAIPYTVYSLNVGSGFVTGTAVTTTLVLTSTGDVPTSTPDETFYALVRYDASPFEPVGIAVFSFGNVAPFAAGVIFAYDGAHAITADFIGELAVDYRIEADGAEFGTGGTITGDATAQQATLTSSAAGDGTTRFFAYFGSPPAAAAAGSILAAALLTFGVPYATPLVWTNVGPQLIVSTSPGLEPGTFTVQRVLTALDRIRRAPFPVLDDNTQAVTVRVAQDGASVRTEILSVDVSVTVHETGVTGGE